MILFHVDFTMFAQLSIIVQLHLRNKLSLLASFQLGTSISSISQVNSALHPSGVAKSSTSFGWGKGGKVTSAGWQVTV